MVRCREVGCWDVQQGEEGGIGAGFVLGQSADSVGRAVFCGGLQCGFWVPTESLL